MTFQGIFREFFRPTLAIFLVAGSAAALAAEASRVQTFSDAMDQYRQGRWSAAYGRFCVLADDGDAQAARIALVMLRHGETMHGTIWSASQPQIEHWAQLARQVMDPLTSESGD